MRAYDADLIETATRDGTFAATLRGSAITATGPDPEHALCHAMTAAGLPDGSIQFWRGTTPSLLFRSVHRSAGYRVELGDDFPYRLVHRRAAPAVFAKDRRAGVSQNHETSSTGTWGHPASMGVPDAMVNLCEAAE